MKAVYINAFGSELDLTIRDIELPKPGVDEVLVRVYAAGLNRADLVQAAGRYPPPAGHSPHIPGLEFAGEIVELGSGVTGWSAGTRVFGITAGEAQAEYLKINAGLLLAIPDNLSFIEAAGVPEAFITAYDAVFSQSGLTGGETLLIHAVGSGVGLAALQLAKAHNATVIGTSRTADKLDRCAEFGLDHGIVVGSDVEFSGSVASFTDGKGANVILDLVGGAYFAQNLLSLAFRGRIIVVGLTSGTSAAADLGVILAKRARITGTFLRARQLDEKLMVIAEFNENVLPMLSDGSIKPNIDRVFPAADVVDAYKYLASNRSFGKVLIEF